MFSVYVLFVLGGSALSTPVRGTPSPPSEEFRPSGLSNVRATGEHDVRAQGEPAVRSEEDVLVLGGADLLFRTELRPSVRAERGQPSLSAPQNVQDGAGSLVRAEPLDRSEGGKSVRAEGQAVRERTGASLRTKGGPLLRADGGSGGGQKSILDFLGIFDTRRFFYIPSERSGDEEEEEEGILETLAKWLKVGS